jgi:FlaA1/EpsC-like NDP-sugar epimerase
MDKQKTKIIFYVFSDVLSICFSCLISFLIRFDFSFPTRYQKMYSDTIIIFLIIKLVTFAILDLYKRAWRYASIKDALYITSSVAISNLFSITIMLITKEGFPKSVLLLMWVFDTIFILSTRVGTRVTLDYMNIYKRKTPEVRDLNVMLIGAGAAGSVVIKEFYQHPEMNKKVVALIDDDRSKQGLLVNGIKVVGTTEDILKMTKLYKIDEIIIAIPTADRQEIKIIVEKCKHTRCTLKTLPGVYELIDGTVSIKKIRDVEIEDLLGREPVKIDNQEISDYIRNRVVVVTGGGGSIGSELCRQLAKFEVKKLIILDIYENNAYDIQNELKRNYKNLNLEVIIASVRDRKRIEEIFKIHRPEVVFHAAAHKHVPLMESNAAEAVKNNVFGTLNAAEMASKYGAKKFVLISTDKAVNPTNIMGATKRLCEMIIQAISKVSRTEFAAVRFGNVLGSNGSVIPLFKKQILAGGPVTVTDLEIIRYFMTIPEAVQLVMQCGAIAKGGEIFVLDMGNPVKIDTLARDLIKLSGFEPDVDIKIIYTGLRPGEKLYEELLMAEEGLKCSMRDKIYVTKPMPFEYEVLQKELSNLKDSINFNSSYENVKSILMKMVPTYIKMGDEVDKLDKLKRDVL